MERTWKFTAAGSKGYSLLEMLVVLAILSITIIVALMFVRPSASSFEPARTAYEMAARLKGARTKAIAANQETSFFLDLQERQFWSKVSPSKAAIPAEIDILMTSAKNRVLTEQLGSFRFFPNGSSTGGNIELNMGAKKISVQVDWLTGAVRVIDAQD